MLLDAVEFGIEYLCVNGRFVRRLELRPPYPQAAMLLVVTLRRAAMFCDIVQSGM
jgi:hypothetical protein